MTRHEIAITMKRRPWIARQWSKLMRHQVRPIMRSRRNAWMWLGILVPYSLRRVHKAIATGNRYFWIPCPLCGKPYGGHEWRNSHGRPCDVPDPLGGGNSFVGICPRCTRRGKGVRL